MTFEELKEKAKEMEACGTIIYDKVIIYHGWLYLYEDGTLKTEGDGCVVEQEIGVSYDQMLAIMKALQWEVK